MIGDRDQSSHGEVGPTQDGSPWVTGSQGAAIRRARGRASRTVLHHFTVLLLMATAGIVVVAALPTVERILSGDPAHTAKRGIARTMWAKDYAVGPPEAARPRLAFGHQAPAMGLRSRRHAPAIGGTIGDPRFGDLDLFNQLLGQNLDPNGDDSAEGSGAIAPRDLVLFDRADSDSDPAAAIRRGQILVVIKDGGDWLLLAFKEGDRFELGWARRDQVKLFP